MSMTVADAAQLLRMEFAEMPGLLLTDRQAQRLCNLTREFCHPALSALVDAGFLRRTADGRYIREDFSSSADAAPRRPDVTSS